MKDNIRINRIRTRSLGPVKKFSLDARDLNLVYGKNESGKTFLVEFIIKSLFEKNPWKLRSEQGEGMVTLRGLEEKEVEFSPGSDRKLGSFIKESLPGLPPAIDKLLIVKGGETEIKPSVDAGNHMEVLKAYLSGRKLLKEISSDIPKGIQKAKVEKDSIDVKYAPAVDKERETAREKIKDIDELLEELNKEYSLGPIFECRRKIRKLEEEKEKYERAKKHLACAVSKEKEKLKARRENLPDEELLKGLSSEIATCRQLEAQARETKDEIESRSETVRRLEWLEEAADIYEKKMQEGASPVFYRSLLTAALVIAGVLVFVYPPVALIPIALAVLLPFILKPRSVNTDEEIKKIKENYKNYFTEELKDISSVKAKLKQLREGKSRFEVFRENLEKTREKIKNSRAKIQRLFLDVSKPPPEEEKWDRVIEEKENRRKQLEEKIKDLEIKLSSLDVEPEEFIEKETDCSYDRDREKEILKEIQRQQEILQKLSSPIDEMRIRIRQITRSPDSSDENLIGELLNARRQAEEEYARATASILGQWCLGRVVKELSGQEEEKIRKALKKKSLREPVRQLTTKYKSLKLKGNKLFLGDGYSYYCLDDLSSGAREQIFLGLRMGMAAELFGKNRIFFILDDAFQHSDWDRREEMVERTVEMASGGWQIFYFTMDDHLRDLFKKLAKKSSVGFSYSEIN